MTDPISNLKKKKKKKKDTGWVVGWFLVMFTESITESISKFYFFDFVVRLIYQGILQNPVYKANTQKH